jgi:hypothetical protein
MTPDVQLSSREAAAIWGIAPSTWRAYVADGLAPQPDGRFGSQNWWWRSTVVEALADRPGQGARSDLK